MKNRVLSISKFFFAAMAVVAIYSFGYLKGLSGAEGEPKTLQVSEAKEMLNTYKQNAQPLTGVLQAVYLDRELLTDLNSVLMARRGASGVRVYIGQDASGRRAPILVPVLNGSSDDTGMIIQSDGMMGICPNVCDNYSTITK
jgi:hypothetical protein